MSSSVEDTIVDRVHQRIARRCGVKRDDEEVTLSLDK